MHSVAQVTLSASVCASSEQLGLQTPAGHPWAPVVDADRGLVNMRGVQTKRVCGVHTHTRCMYSPSFPCYRGLHLRSVAPILFLTHSPRMACAWPRCRPATAPPSVLFCCVKALSRQALKPAGAWPPPGTWDPVFVKEGGRRHPRVLCCSSSWRRHWCRCPHVMGRSPARVSQRPWLSGRPTIAPNARWCAQAFVNRRMSYGAFLPAHMLGPALWAHTDGTTRTLTATPVSMATTHMPTSSQLEAAAAAAAAAAAGRHWKAGRSTSNSKHHHHTALLSSNNNSSTRQWQVQRLTWQQHQLARGVHCRHQKKHQQINMALHQHCIVGWGTCWCVRPWHQQFPPWGQPLTVRAGCGRLVPSRLGRSRPGCTPSPAGGGVCPCALQVQLLPA
jgi:hypothetical protein